MNAIATHVLPSHLLAELALHLRNSGSGFTVTQAATEAIRAWIAVNPPQQPAVDDSAPSQGYQWKTLFLPSGTELRMSTRESTYFARVVGNDILFEGRRVSPRGMTIAIAGNGRNAWRDLWLKLPAERYWKQAIRCRHEHERKASVPGDSPVLHPAENIAAAAVTMSDALKTTLTGLIRRARRVNMPARAFDQPAHYVYNVRVLVPAGVITLAVKRETLRCAAPATVNKRRLIQGGWLSL